MKCQQYAEHTAVLAHDWLLVTQRLHQLLELIALGRKRVAEVSEN